MSEQATFEVRTCDGCEKPMTVPIYWKWSQGVCRAYCPNCTTVIIANGDSTMLNPRLYPEIRRLLK